MEGEKRENLFKNLAKIRNDFGNPWNFNNLNS